MSKDAKAPKIAESHSRSQAIIYIDYVYYQKHQFKL